MKRSLTLLAAALSTSAAVFAAPPVVETPARVDSQHVVELLTRLQRLQDEIRDLRGQVEEQGNRLEDVQRRQREQYVDVDKRMGTLETARRQPSLSDNPEPADDYTYSSELPPADDEPAQDDRLSERGGAEDFNTDAEFGDEQGAYDQALDLLKDRRYPEAARELRSFLATYSSSRLADNAQYWLGETNYVMRNYEAALEEFNKVVQLYPHSTKLPDAWLKIGFIHYERRAWDKARQALTRVTTRFPDSAAARLAHERLDRMDEDGQG